MGHGYGNKRSTTTTQTPVLQTPSGCVFAGSGPSGGRQLESQLLRGCEAFEWCAGARRNTLHSEVFRLSTAKCGPRWLNHIRPAWPVFWPSVFAAKPDGAVKRSSTWLDAPGAERWDAVRPLTLVPAVAIMLIVERCKIYAPSFCTYPGSRG